MWKKSVYKSLSFLPSFFFFTLMFVIFFLRLQSVSFYYDFFRFQKLSTQV